MIRLILSVSIVFSLIEIQNSWGEPIAAKDGLMAKIDQVMAEKKPHDQLTRLSDLGAKLSLEEIPLALAASRNFNQWRQQAVLQQAALRHWAELAPTQAFSYIAKLPESSFKVENIHFAAIKFATEEPERAAIAAAQLSPGPSRLDAINTTVATWAQTDSRKALEWVDSLPEGGIKESAVKSVLFVWVHIDPTACAPRIQVFPPGNVKNALITNAAAEWAILDPQGAIKWANGLPDGPEKELAIENAAESWADSDPKAASEFVLQLPPGTMRQQAAAGVAERWATQNPTAVAHWITIKLDSVSQQIALPRLLNFWAMENPQESGNWVASLSAGTFRENAVLAYVQAVNNWAPDLGANQAITLVDESARYQKVTMNVRHWLELDSSAAQQWLQKANLPQEVKNQCLMPEANL